MQILACAPCKFHAKGSCKAGNTCPYPHWTGGVNPAKSDKPSAGLALGLLTIRHSQSQDIARDDSCAVNAEDNPSILIARGDPSRRIEFAANYLEIAGDGCERFKSVDLKKKETKEDMRHMASL